MITLVNIKVIGVYILSGSPEHVVLGYNVTVTLTCVWMTIINLLHGARTAFM